MYLHPSRPILGLFRNDSHSITPRPRFSVLFVEDVECVLLDVEDKDPVGDGEGLW